MWFKQQSALLPMVPCIHARTMYILDVRRPVVHTVISNEFIQSTTHPLPNDRLFKNRFPWQVGFFKKYINVTYSRTYLNKGNTSSMWPSQDQWPQTAKKPWKLMAVPFKGTKKNNIWTNHWFQEISYLALGNPSNLFCSCRYTTEN